MSKELVISAASHERRVAILEEGQLVEIYIEREKEFALVGSIYKGKVTRVLPGMQSAFVDIGLDGDAFLYVSDVFENLEDYDPGHPHEHTQTSVASLPAAIGSPVEVLPGESLARANEHHEEAHHEEFHRDEAHSVDEPHASHEEEPPTEGQHFEEHRDAAQSAPLEEHHAEAPEERQPDSNASAPQNFAPHYNPTQNYPARGGNDRPGQNFGRSGDRSNDRGGDRGGDRGRGGRWGRRGGRHRSGRPQGGPGARNLPPSKYASPQGGEARGYDNRGGQPRSYDNRRAETPRSSAPSVTSVSEEEIILPGESLAKYRNKPAVAPAPVPVVEHETHEERPAVEEITPRATANLPAAAATGGVPRRFSGGLPRWLLADAGAEVEAPPSGEAADSGEETSATGLSEPPLETAVNHVEGVRNDVELNEDQVAALASGFVEAKHEETQEEAEADAVVGGAEFDEEEDEEQSEEVEETIVTEVSQLSEEEAEEVEAGRAANRAEFAADVAQEHAEHDAAHGSHEHGEQGHVEHEYVEAEHVEEEVLSAAPRESVAEISPVIEDDVILLPGETRASRIGGPAAPREDFPRDSARIGGNPRSRFQRPFRSGGRDRGRGGRPDSRGGRPDRGGRPGGGPRFERRPGGPRHNRGYQGGHSGPSRRPQLISEMLKAGQDVEIGRAHV